MEFLEIISFSLEYVIIIVYGYTTLNVSDLGS